MEKELETFGVNRMTDNQERLFKTADQGCMEI